MEEQFDLQVCDRQTDVKETDILSDDDEYCESVKGSSAEPSLEEAFEALIAEVEEEQKEEDKKAEDSYPNKGPEKKPPEKTLGQLRLTPLRKQCAVEGDVAPKEVEVIWVRREDFNSGCGTDIFWSQYWNYKRVKTYVHWDFWASFLSIDEAVRRKMLMEKCKWNAV